MAIGEFSSSCKLSGSFGAEILPLLNNRIKYHFEIEFPLSVYIYHCTIATNEVKIKLQLSIVMDPGSPSPFGEFSK